MAFKFLGQRQLGKLPSRWVSTILMVAIGWWSQNAPANCIGGLFWGDSGYSEPRPRFALPD